MKIGTSTYEKRTQAVCLDHQKAKQVISHRVPVGIIKR